MKRILTKFFDAQIPLLTQLFFFCYDYSKALKYIAQKSLLLQYRTVNLLESSKQSSHMKIYLARDKLNPT